MPHKNVHRLKAGFTLLEITVVLLVASVVLTGLLPLLLETMQGNRTETTMTRLAAIERSLQAVAFNDGLPCPASMTDRVDAASFGRELSAGLGSCNHGVAGWPAGDIKGGMIPTKTLLLPDEYAFDGWGRRFSYHVDEDLTDPAVFNDPLSNGDIVVNDRTGTPRTNAASYVVISHGQNGHGGYLLSNALNVSGSVNNEEHVNCVCDNTGATDTTSYGTFFQSMYYLATPGSADTAFDDITQFKTQSLLR